MMNKNGEHISKICPQMYAENLCIENDRVRVQLLIFFLVEIALLVSRTVFFFFFSTDLEDE